MKCAVVVPVGPGHEYLVEDCIESVHQAFAADRGPFAELSVVRVEDAQGLLGRSAARNRGVAEARKQDAQWVFFLDADDLMHPHAFASVAPHVGEWDAIWGAICELAPDESGGLIRPGQIEKIRGITDLLVHEPWLTLQMGHFVRTRVAQDNPFNVGLNCGEDFDYYLRLWSACRCTKLPVPLFYNRRGFQSTGPRSATGSDWTRAVTSMLAEQCAARGLKARFTLEGEAFEFCISNPFDMLQRHFLVGRFFEQRELHALRALLSPGLTLLEVGANVGNHVVYYARFLRPRKIIVLEPFARAILDLKRNLELNGAACADLTLVGIAAAEVRRRYTAVAPDPNDLGATRLIAAGDGAIEAAPLDELVREPVDFVRIDVEGMEMEVLAGATELIGRRRPKLMVEVGNEKHAAFERWCKDMAYRITHRFAYMHAANFIVEPK